MSEEIKAAKRAAGEQAASLVESNMIVGLGTGSTAFWAIKRLGERVAEGLQIEAVATSEESENLARQWNIPILPFADVKSIDIDIDGADEIDPNFNLIKGGGGALLREKIIAVKSKKMVIVADESKSVTTLGRFPLPVEVVPFAIEWTIQRLKSLCKKVVLRQKEEKPYITDNGNYILDCDFFPINHPQSLSQELNNIPGVVENGLFVNLCTQVIIGHENK